MNSNLIKTAIFILVLFSAINVRSETIQIKVFFDQDWVVCKPQNAFYYRICGWDKTKNCYEGEFADYLINESNITRGNYSQGKKEGLFTFYYPSGSEKIRVNFKEDKPDGLWSWFYPDKTLNFRINFTPEQFEVVELNDLNGRSILKTTNEFIYEFQNITSIENMHIVGSLENGTKEGRWMITTNNKSIGYDLYKNGNYKKTVFDSGLPPVLNERLINNALFVPYSIYACDELRLNKDVSEADYSFLSYRFTWIALESAYGIAGDSIFTEIEKKPMYIDGMDGINKIISKNVVLTIEAIEKSKHWGYVYYDIKIDENGQVIEKNIIKSPDVLLNEIVLKCLSHLGRFKPAYNRGVAIQSKFASRVKFDAPTRINLNRPVN